MLQIAIAVCLLILLLGKLTESMCDRNAESYQDFDDSHLVMDPQGGAKYGLFKGPMVHVASARTGPMPKDPLRPKHLHSPEIEDIDGALVAQLASVGPTEDPEEDPVEVVEDPEAQDYMPYGAHV
jgi:hypothetical protein